MAGVAYLALPSSTPADIGGTVVLLPVPGMLRFLHTFHQNAISAFLEGSSKQCRLTLPCILSCIVGQVKASQGFTAEGHWKILEDPLT